MADGEQHDELNEQPKNGATIGSKADLVNQAYVAFGQGDIPGLLELVADGVDWASPATLPTAPRTCSR